MAGLRALQSGRAAHRAQHRRLPARGAEETDRSGGGHAGARRRARPGRSEEHTSELQSLMRISYAVFCLKKKTYTILKSYTTSNQTNIKRLLTHNITRIH